MMQSDLLS